MKKLIMALTITFSLPILASDFHDCFDGIYKLSGEEVNKKVSYCFSEFRPENINECIEGAGHGDDYAAGDQKLLFCKKEFPSKNIDECLNISSHFFDSTIYNQNIKECFSKNKIENLSDCQKHAKKGALQEQKEFIFQSCLKNNTTSVNEEFCDKILDVPDYKSVNDLPVLCAAVFYKKGFKNCIDKANALKNNDFHDIITMECLDKEKTTFDYCMSQVKELRVGLYKFGAMNICIKKKQAETAVPGKKSDSKK